MRLGSTLILLAWWLLNSGLVNADAAPIPACVAGDIIAGDPGCPSSGPCSISQIFSIGDGCVLDFGTRNVTIAASGELRIAGATVTLKAGNFTVAPGGLVDGTTMTVGGSFTVEATGNIAVQKGSTTVGKILVSGSTQGGSISLDAGGDIRIDGELQADNRSTLVAPGGDIALSAGGDIVTGASSIIDPHGGLQAFGGFLDLLAAGLIDIGNSIDNSGGDGGDMNMSAGGKVIIRDQLNTTGEGDAGSGGDIDIVAGSDVEIYAKVQSRGTASGTGSGGGDGGAVYIGASFGDITVGGEITVLGGYPDGGGGDIELLAQGSIDVQPAGGIIANGNGPDSWGGEILLGARIDVMINGPLQAEAGDCGGEIGIEAGRDIALNARLNARSTRAGSFGGSVTIEAGLVTSGNLTLASVIDVSGPICDLYGFCSIGGDADASACDLTVQSSGMIMADAPGSGGNGGAIFLTARDLLTILGSLNATGAGGSLDGSNTLIHPAAVSPVVSGSVSPQPTMMPRSPCIGGSGNPPFCLIPCPVCGDGVTEFPETCDTAGTPASCDGCSRFCQLEDCNDANSCTADSCDPVLGCLSTFRPNGTPCGDETICNGEELCLGGTCLAGQPLDCRDTNPCTLDSCDAVTGCQNDPLAGEPCEDGDACTEPDICNAAGICVSGGQIVCDDGNECTEDSCNPASGCAFSHLSFVPCTADGDPCTDDTCSLGVCLHPARAEGSSCNDADPCTQTDTCLGGICTGSNPVVCTALDQCHGAGECVPALGTCTNPKKDDGTGCEDGNLCTRTDTCQGGTCTGSSPVICTALDQCHNAGLCDPGTGTCSNPAKPNGTPCSDGLYCTVDSCQAGTCTSTTRDCSDDNDCTVDSCDESGDTCVQEPIALCCGNGIVEEGEECDEGAENSDEPNATCRTDCRASRCGNGVLDNLFGETCDLGEANSDEPNASCRTDCLEQRCGDGVVDDLSGEQCDNGNTGPDGGCSPRCFVDPPPTASLIPGKGSTKTDCIIEWKMDDVSLDKKGRPSHRQSCVDGDPACDHDGAVNGQCIFHMWLCSNNTDPDLPLCQTGTGPNGKGVVIVVQVKEPSLKRALKMPAHGETRMQLLGAGAAAPVGNGLDVCGPRLSLRVPHKALGRKGVIDLRIRATTSLNVKDTDVLRLTCWP